MPPLEKGGWYPGTLILPSKRACVFLGTDSHSKPINTIESLELGQDYKWTVAMVKKPHGNVKLDHLIATQFQGSIVLFRMRYPYLDLFEYN